MFQSLLVVCLVAMAALASESERVSPPPGLYRGELVLRFDLEDRGVAYYQTSDYDLRVELDIARNGSVTLRAKGTCESRHTWLTSPPRSEARKPATIDDLWQGRFDKEHRLRLVKSVASKGVEHELRCTPERAVVRGRSIGVVRCDAASHYSGLPWEDRVPDYLRVPLVLAARGSVRSSVNGSHRGATIHLLSFSNEQSR